MQQPGLTSVFPLPASPLNPLQVLSLLMADVSVAAVIFAACSWWYESGRESAFTCNIFGLERHRGSPRRTSHRASFPQQKSCHAISYPVFFFPSQMFRSAYFPSHSTNITTVFVSAPKYDFRKSKQHFFGQSCGKPQTETRIHPAGAATSGPCPTNGTLPQNQRPSVSHSFVISSIKNPRSTKGIEALKSVDFCTNIINRIILKDIHNRFIFT